MGMAVSAGLGIIGQVNSFNEQQDLANAQRTQAVTQMNYAFQTHEMERQDAFDSMVEEITKTNMKNASTMGTVNTAIGENVSGRTAGLLSRNGESKGAMTNATLADNWKKKSNEMDLNKEATLRSTQSYLANIKDPSITALALGVGSSVMGVMNEGRNAEAEAKSNGLTFDWNNYMWKGKGAVGYDKKTPKVPASTT